MHWRRRRRLLFSTQLLMIPTNKSEKQEKLIINYEKIKELVITSVGRDSPPITRSMLLNVGNEDDVFFWSPWPFLHTHFVTARWSSHIQINQLIIYIYIYLERDRKWNDWRKGVLIDLFGIWFVLIVCCCWCWSSDELRQEERQESKWGVGIRYIDKRPKVFVA